MSAHSRRVDESHHQLASNAVVSLTGRIAAVVLSLAMAIGLFRILGAGAYGAWSLLAAVLTATSVFDLGLPGAVEREVASGRATGEPTRAGGMIGTAIAVSAAMAAMAQGALFMWSRVSLAAHTPPWQAVWLLPSAVFLSIVALLLVASLTGVQQFVAAHGWRLTGLLVGTAATVGIAWLGVTRFEWLVTAYMCGSLVTIVGCRVSLARTWPGVRIRYRRSVLPALIHLGGGMQAASLAPLVADYALRIIAGQRFGSAAPGLYDLAARVSIVGRSLGGALMAALVPYSVALFESADLARVRALHRAAAAVMTAAMLGATVAGLLGTRAIARAIAGPLAESDALAATIVVMLLAHLAAAAFVPALLMARAAARPWAEAVATSVAALAGLAAATVTPSLVWAAAVVWTAQALAFFGAWRWLCRTLPLDGVFTARAARLSMCALMALAAGGAVHYALGTAERGLPGSLLGVGAGCAVYVVAAFSLDLVPPELSRAVAGIGARRERGV